MVQEGFRFYVPDCNGRLTPNLYCRDCYAERNTDKAIANRQKDREETKIWREHHLYRAWSQRTLRNHRQRGCTTLVTVGELEKLAEATVACNICGGALNWGGNNIHAPDFPTLDRTNNDTALTLQNIQITHRQCNEMKNSMPMDEFIAYCKHITERFC